MKLCELSILLNEFFFILSAFRQILVILYFLHFILKICYSWRFILVHSFYICKQESCTHRLTLQCQIYYSRLQNYNHVGLTKYPKVLGRKWGFFRDLSNLAPRFLRIWAPRTCWRINFGNGQKGNLSSVHQQGGQRHVRTSQPRLCSGGRKRRPSAVLQLLCIH